MVTPCSAASCSNALLALTDSSELRSCIRWTKRRREKWSTKMDAALYLFLVSPPFSCTKKPTWVEIMRLTDTHSPGLVCVCVNSTSGGEETLATPAYQGWLARNPLPLGAAVNKIKGATLTPPNAQARALRVSASLAPGIGVEMVLGSVA